MVSVSTKKLSDKIVISVRDNGTGIPRKVMDRIFQPFFTTKPTGEGTGLGLSMSYDIIKAHGGELKAETEKGVCRIYNTSPIRFAGTGPVANHQCFQHNVCLWFN